MTGFFSKEELPSLIKKEQISDGTECYQCGLFKRCQNPKAKISGQGLKKILIISESPTEVEDKKGHAFTGKAGRLLKTELAKVGIDFNKDCWKTYALLCRVTKLDGSAKDPTKQELQLCNQNLQDTIAKLKPTVIIPLGKFAIMSLLLGRFNKVKINTFRGLIIPDRKYNAWILPVYHPSSLHKENKSENLTKLWKRDIQQAAKFALTAKPLKERPNPQAQVELTTDYPRIVEILNTVIAKEPKTFYFDYETTGLKPDAPGHKIPYVSFSTDGKKAYSFPFQHKDFFTKEEQNHLHSLLTSIFENQKIIKAAHNFKFEEIWTQKLFRTFIDPWGMDALLASHIWDNRAGFTGLKFQTYILFGIAPYDGDIKRYLQAENSNGFNQVENIPVEKALLYSAYDSLYGYWVYSHYENLLNKPENKKLLYAYNLLHDGNLVFADMQMNGVCADEKYYNEKNIEIRKEISELSKKLLQSPEAQKFQKKHGRAINIDSSKDLSDLLYNILKYKAEANEKGNKSVDKEALEEINTPFTQQILKIRQLTKIVGTYLNQFKNEIIKNKIHFMFNLNIPVTYRSSSQSPNLQNIPIREELAKKVCRGGIIPSPGHKLLESDYSGIEVRVSACVHKDPNMIKYITDPSTDMHRDCYDLKTKVLTENGFKYYNEIKKDEKIAQYNPDRDKIEFVMPLHRIYHEYEGKMYQIKGKNIDLLVTPNHRLFFKKVNKQYKITNANKITNGKYYFKTGADTCKIVPPPEFYFDAVYGIATNKTKKYHESFKIETNDMFELLGYLITDGHFKYHKQKTYRINLSQFKEPHRTIMKNCIDRIKSYTEFKFHESKNMWAMSNKTMCNWLCENFGVNKVKRKLPDFIKYAPLEQLYIFFKSCLLGDGKQYASKNAGTFYAVSKQLVEDFQFICMRLGYKTQVYKCELKENRTVQVYRINIQYKNEFALYWNETNIKKKQYKGKVFCFTVPSGLLVIQRNSKICIQGNCASDVWMLPHDKVTREIRQSAKSDVVFPEFYGSFYKNCAKNSWKTVIDGNFKLQNGILVKDHLAKQGIKNYQAFEKHCEKVEDIFWNERFKVYSQWKKEINALYNKQGWIENKFGFKFKGYMGENDVTNYPIQSTAFLCMLWSLMHIHEIAIKEQWRTKIFGQIHDSILFDLHPDEEEHVIKTINYVGTQKLRETFDWIIVPMAIEYELTDINQPWSTKKEVDYKHLF